MTTRQSVTSVMSVIPHCAYTLSLTRVMPFQGLHGLLGPETEQVPREDAMENHGLHGLLGRQHAHDERMGLRRGGGAQ